jgi:transposase
VNILSVIYAMIYFPTYTNGLKDVAGSLGFKWTDSSASGLKSVQSRLQWEASNDELLKQELITYNTEDCMALVRVTNAIAALSKQQCSAESVSSDSIVFTDSIVQRGPFRFGKNNFCVPEFQLINDAAYWDHQRDKVYIRSSPLLRRARKVVTKRSRKPLPVNQVAECPPATHCPKCQSRAILRYGRGSQIVPDLRFCRDGVKRWVVKFLFRNYLCNHCGARFYPPERPWAKNRLGSQLRAYLIYQSIELRLPQETIARSLNQLFGFDFQDRIVVRQKTRASQYYESTYEAILHKLVAGDLLQVDETKIHLKSRDGFVWVFTNLEEVFYFYTDTREGTRARALMEGFNGVLVSDFYSAYDSFACRQQKCLIHLIRDLNDAALEEPFNEELREIVRGFGQLLEPMVETVDRVGLKAYFLCKHKATVGRFYNWLASRSYRSELAVTCKKRLEKNQEKLFTFLDCDGVPWNNNNAEHAIKAFAALRRLVGGSSTERGMREYLILLSVCETCKCKGVSFLDFLRSSEQEIDAFVQGRRHRGRTKG